MFVLIHVSCVRNINSCKNLQKPSSNEVLHLQRPAKLRFINLNRTMAGSIPDIYFTIDITGSPTKVETLKTTLRNIYGLKTTVRNVRCMIRTSTRIYRC